MNKLNLKYSLFYLSYVISLLHSLNYIALNYSYYYLVVVVVFLTTVLLLVVFGLLINGVERFEQFTDNRIGSTLKIEKVKASIRKTEAETTWILTKIERYNKRGEAPKSPILVESVNDRVLVDLSNIIGKKYYKSLLESIIGYKRVLLVGAQGSGKTSVMQWLAEYKKVEGNLFVIDTHSAPRKWPKPSFVIGAGEDYQKAKTGLDLLMNTLSRRYVDIGKGSVKEGHHKPITLFSDEWTLLPDNIQNFTKGYVKPLFTKSRKCNVHLSLAVHDTSVAALGMEGLSNLKNSFEVVVYCKKVRNEFSTEVSYGFGKDTSRERFAPPGPYIEDGIPLMPQNNEYRLESIKGIDQNDLPILNASRTLYNSSMRAVSKVNLRKLLEMSANKESYKKLEDVSRRYNITMI